MAVLTHMVGRLGAMAILDRNIQAVLYALLQRGLGGTPAQQEVLVEDAVKLLNATLAASSSLSTSLQVITYKHISLSAQSCQSIGPDAEAKGPDASKA